MCFDGNPHVESGLATGRDTMAEPALTILFGPEPITFESDAPQWAGLLERRFKDAALRGDEAGFLIRHYVDGVLPDGLFTAMARRTEPSRVTETGEGFTLLSQTFSATVDLRKREAVLRSPLALYPLDALLTALLPTLFPRSLLVHSALIGHGDRGFLCCGPSGSGKSTIAGLCGDAALCDELVLVDVPMSAAVQAEPLPFNMYRTGKVLLKGVLMIRHGTGAHEFRRAGRREALQRIFREILWPYSSMGAAEMMLSTLETLLIRVPVWDFGFLPSDDVWTVITNFNGGNE